MKLVKVSAGKEFKIGLPNYSNTTVRCDLQFDIGEGEKVDWNAIWDEINQQMAIQSDNLDPSWMETKEYKNYFKVTVKQPKLTDQDRKEVE
jgi:hypothetical protein